MRSVLIVLESGTEIFPATAIVRALQFADLFQQNSQVRAAFVSRRSPEFLRFCARLQRRWWSRRIGNILARFEGILIAIREGMIVKRSRRFDCVYLLRTASGRLHGRLRRESNAKIVMDFNDGLWLPFFRRPGGGFDNLDEMLRSSHAIACENESLLTYAKQYNQKAYLVPDAPQVEEFDKARQRFKPRADRITLGWIGSPSTADSLHSIFEPLEELFRQDPRLHLRILGASAGDLPRFEKVRFSCKAPYSNQEMIEEALQMDIGLYPLYRTQDSIVRGTLKARIYMSAGIAAACQNWGEMPALIEHKVNGVLSDSADDWRTNLQFLIDDASERGAIAERGLATVRGQFTRQLCFDRLVSILMSV